MELVSCRRETESAILQDLECRPPRVGSGQGCGEYFSTCALLQVKDKRGDLQTQNDDKSDEFFLIACPFPGGGCLHYRSSI